MVFVRVLKSYRYVPPIKFQPAAIPLKHFLPIFYHGLCFACAVNRSGSWCIDRNRCLDDNGRVWSKKRDASERHLNHVGFVGACSVQLGLVNLTKLGGVVLQENEDLRFRFFNSERKKHKRWLPFLFPHLIYPNGICVKNVPCTSAPKYIFQITVKNVFNPSFPPKTPVGVSTFFLRRLFGNSRALFTCAARLFGVRQVAQGK